MLSKCYFPLHARNSHSLTAKSRRGALDLAQTLHLILILEQRKELSLWEMRQVGKLGAMVSPDKAKTSHPFNQTAVSTYSKYTQPLGYKDG